MDIEMTTVAKHSSLHFRLNLETSSVYYFGLMQLTKATHIYDADVYVCSVWFFIR